ncbi:MAG: hypothetical protein U0559_00270 [Anaerolineae bacterium]
MNEAMPMNLHDDLAKVTLRRHVLARQLANELFTRYPDQLGKRRVSF